MRKQSVTSEIEPLILQHFARWKDCAFCPLFSSARSKVFFRGRLPAKVLFIGTAPTDGDQDCGMPFSGEAGDILDSIIDNSIGKYNAITGYNTISHAVTLTCICRPGEGVAIGKEHRQACSPRLAEFVQIAKPKLLVLVGKVAQSAANSLWARLPEMIRTLDMDHPASYMIKRESKDPVLETQRAIVNINQALINVFGRPVNRRQQHGCDDVPF